MNHESVSAASALSITHISLYHLRPLLFSLHGCFISICLWVWSGTALGQCNDKSLDDWDDLAMLWFDLVWHWQCNAHICLCMLHESTLSVFELGGLQPHLLNQLTHCYISIFVTQPVFVSQLFPLYPILHTNFKVQLLVFCVGKSPAAWKVLTTYWCDYPLSPVWSSVWGVSGPLPTVTLGLLSTLLSMQMTQPGL